MYLGTFFRVNEEAKADDLVEEEIHFVEEVVERLRHVLALANLDGVIRKY